MNKLSSLNRAGALLAMVTAICSACSQSKPIQNQSVIAPTASPVWTVTSVTPFAPLLIPVATAESTPQSEAGASGVISKPVKSSNAARTVAGERFRFIEWRMKSEEPFQGIDSLVLSLDIAYPEFDTSVAGYQALNDAIRTNAENWKREFIVTSVDSTRDRPSTAVTALLSVSYTVVENSRLILGIEQFTTWWILPAPYAIVFGKKVNLDLESGKLIGLSDLFVSGSGYEKVLESAIVADLEKRGMPSYQKIDIGLIRTAEWTLRSDGLMIAFEPGQIAPYRLGFVRFNIPDSAIGRYLKPRFGSKAK